MTPAMVERVARALCKRHYEERFRGAAEMQRHVEANMHNWHLFKDDALTAIEAHEAALKADGFQIVKVPPHHGIMFAHLVRQSGAAALK